MNRFTTPAMRLLATITSVFLLSANAFAKSESEPKDDEWQFVLNIYGWLPSVSGNTKFSGSGGSSGVNVDAGDILDSLEGVLMAGIDVRKGRWGVAADVIYLDLSNSKSKSRSASFTDFDIPANANLSADLALRGWTVTSAVTYSMIHKPDYSLQVLGGFRYLQLDEELNWNFSGNVGSIPINSRSGKSTVDSDVWDAVVGVRGQARIGASKWFVPYYLDIGTGESDFTWQGMTGVGYAFRTLDVVVAYRYLDWNFGSDKALEDLSFGGPLAGVKFHW